MKHRPEKIHLNHYNSILLKKIFTTKITAFTALFILIFISGCRINSTHTYYKQTAKTILSFEELRKPIQMQEPKTIMENGKIILYENYLMINEPNLGVHIIDNTVPESPIPIGFLPIPGNTDIVVRNNSLYAKSYIDLVVLDISDMGDIKNQHRNKAIFTPLYNPEYYGVGPEDGVILEVEYIRIVEER